jgi:hypothetical protein
MFSLNVMLYIMQDLCFMIHASCRAIIRLLAHTVVAHFARHDTPRHELAEHVVAGRGEHERAREVLELEVSTCATNVGRRT